MDAVVYCGILFRWEEGQAFFVFRDVFLFDSFIVLTKNR